MKYLTTPYFAFIATLLCIAAISSCSRNDTITGSWTGTATRIGNIPDAADASAVITMSFDDANTAADKGGDVMLSAIIDVNQAVSSPNAVIDEPYEVSVAATATISGRYVFEDRDKDDIILSLDPSTLQVNVDPAGVTYSQNILSGKQRPQLDSLTSTTIARWRIEITKAIRDEFYKYQKISGIEVHHGNILSCEIDDRDYSFRKAE